jgi:predicted dehydrogenase
MGEPWRAPVAERTLRGAMIGAGSITPYHLTAWSHTEGVEIVAIYNRTIDKAQTLAARFGVSPDCVYDDLAAMLDREPGLDFVDIATAPDMHRPHVEAAAARRVNVLCQKPLAPSLADAHAMIDACQRAGVLFSVNENWRWRSWYRDVRRLLDEGTVGQPRYIRIAAHRNVTLGLPGSAPTGLLTRQSYTRTMPRLILYEWGIHLVDTLRMLFGEPCWVHAPMARLSPHVAGEDRALMTFGFGEAGEVTASVDISWSTVVGEELPTMLEEVTIEGDRGTISLVPNRGDGDLVRITRLLPEDRLPVDRDRPWSPIATTSASAHDGDVAAAYQASYDAAHGHFADCLRSGRLPETHAVDNLKTLRAVFAAYRSAAKNRVVPIEEEYEGDPDV